MKKPFTLQIDDDVRNDLIDVAKGGHMNETKYAAVWINELASLKPEFALKVLGLIPPEWKHRRPGRPTGSKTANREHGTLPEQNVA